jgi:hypothetical protein
MKPLAVIGMTVIGLVWAPAISLGAEGTQRRPIQQLPDDVVRWSTIWLQIPEQMMEVGRTDGPIAAFTWGPTKGAAVMVESTVKELWEAAKPDKRPGRRRAARPGEPRGVMVRYEF